jgi:hypothetical protein
MAAIPPTRRIELSPAVRTILEAQNRQKLLAGRGVRRLVRQSLSFMKTAFVGKWRITKME